MMDFSNILNELNNGASEEEIVAAFTAALNSAKEAKVTTDRAERLALLLNQAAEFIADFYPNETELHDELINFAAEPNYAASTFDEILTQAKILRSYLTDLEDITDLFFPGTDNE
jgi:hypothetical protein